MRNRYKLIALITVTILLQSTIQAYAQRNGASLRGGEVDKTMKLYWETYDWPQTLTGFNIKKQSGEGSSWNKLNAEVIYPQIDERNWQNQGLNEEQGKEVQEAYLKYLSEGKLSKITKNILLQKLRETDGLKSGDRLNMKQDYAVALILGFAFIDNTYKKSEKVTYGLFYVYEDGHESEQPMATFAPENIQIKPDITCSVSKGKLKLSWSVNEKDYSTAGLYGFKISRKEDKSGKTANLTEELLGFQNSDNGQLHWLYVDESAIPSLDYTYTFIPVTILQTELKPFEYTFKAALYQNIHTPFIDSILVVNDVDLRIHWNTDTLLSYKKRIKEFYLEKRHVDTLKFTRITKSLALKSKSYTDTTNLLYGQSYMYRLSVTDQKGKQWEGIPATIFYTGVRLPARPDSLKAELRMILDKPYVYISWAKSTNKNTFGFVFQSDEDGTGKLIENLSIPLIKSNELLYEISGDGGIEYQFSIIPVNEKGMRGEGRTIKCQIPLLKLPEFTNCSATLDKNNLVQLLWEYPKEAEIKGFNVLVNGQVIATYNELSKDTRKYTVQLYMPEDAKKVNLYQVEAIGTVASRKSSVAPLYLPKYNVAPPENIHVELVKEKGKSYAVLTWISNKDQEKDIKEYILFTDETVENAFSQFMSIEAVEEMKYKYLITDPDRSSYTFQVAAVSDKDEISPVASTTLTLKAHKK